MKDLSTAIKTCNNSSLASLFEIGRSMDTSSTDANDESLEHLLSIPIECVLNQFPQGLADRLRHSSKQLHLAEPAQDSKINTFGELFCHPHPPHNLLKFAKEVGKEIVNHGRTVWPVRVGEVLYYAAYAAALIRQQGLVGELSNAALEKSFTKLVAREWVGEEMNKLFQDARRQLAKS